MKGKATGHLSRIDVKDPVLQSQRVGNRTVHTYANQASLYSIRRRIETGYNLKISDWWKTTIAFWDFSGIYSSMLAMQAYNQVYGTKSELPDDSPYLAKVFDPYWNKRYGFKEMKAMFQGISLRKALNF